MHYTILILICRYFSYLSGKFRVGGKRPAPKIRARGAEKPPGKASAAAFYMPCYFTFSPACFRINATKSDSGIGLE